MRCQRYSCLLNLLCLALLIFLPSTSSEDDCVFRDVGHSVSSIACAVERGAWYLPSDSSAIKNAGCLLGANRCSKKRTVPTKNDIPPSPPPPSAMNKQYQALATTAEEIVPKTWWREGFADPQLLLTANDSELPRKQFDVSRLRNKKLKNLLQCVTRQQFIRKSYAFDKYEIHSEAKEQKCTAMTEPVVASFLVQWQTADNSENFGGKLIKESGSERMVWAPTQENDGKLLVSALQVLDHFYANYGGVWTGCFKFDMSPSCRGALAAASLVASVHMIYDYSCKRKDLSESGFLAGYILSSLGRGLLHGDTESTGNTPLTIWKLKYVDFVALQGAYMKLYIKSYGAIYTSQLNNFIPMAFQPDFDVQATPEWKHLAGTVEPVYSSLRNWMYNEVGSLIDFGPYRPLVAEYEVRKQLLSTSTSTMRRNSGRRILIDVGANGFYASPKYLIDTYSAYAPFTHVIMVEPEPHFSATVPLVYSERYNITFLQIYAEVNTGSKIDMVKLLPSLVSKDDFVVLKFDVDPNRHAQGPTMEWGFLFSLMQDIETAQLVDELYIELHFHFPALYWKHYHSNWEALDAFRYLREKGLIVHSWP